MKKSLLFLAVQLFAIAVCAQDVIITKEGDALKVFELEVSKKFVFYKEQNSADSPIKRVDKQDLLMIKYNDGRKIIIGEEDEENKPAASQTSTPAVAEQKAPAGIDCSDDAANAAAIERINSIEVHNIAKHLSKEADILFYQCKVNEGSIVADKHIELKFDIPIGTTIDSYHNSITIIARNKSNKTIYIDLGKTFLVRGSESIQCYVPSATSQTDGSTTGGSVNLGAVAGAMGVGGSLGTLANGINVGGASSSATTTTTFAQRVVPVPPMSEREIGTFEIFPKANQRLYNNLEYKVQNSGMTVDQLYTFFQKEQIPRVGEERVIYNKNLIRFGAIVVYAEDEQQNNQQTINTMFDVKKIIGFNAKSLLGSKVINESHLSPDFKESVYFIARPKEL